jgi:hypothetical protein
MERTRRGGRTVEVVAVGAGVSGAGAAAACGVASVMVRVWLEYEDEVMA